MENLKLDTKKCNVNVKRLPLLQKLSRFIEVIRTFLDNSQFMTNQLQAFIRLTNQKPETDSQSEGSI